MQKNKIWIVLAVVILAIAALVYWLMPQSSTSESTSHEQTADTQSAEQIRMQQAMHNNAAASFLSPSQQDTEINCQLRLNSSNRLIVNEQTRNCFEYFITQYGEKSLEAISTDFKAYITQSHKEPALSQILDLWQRYLDYRNALGQLQTPNLSQEDPQYYRSIFSNMQNLRKQYFSDYEIEGLFGTEDAYHEYTLKRMAVMDDKKLSEAEKARQLQELFKQLPQDWQENLEQLNTLQDLRSLTAAIKARGGSAAEIRQMRLNLVGPEATQRLEQLDGQRSQWKSRVEDYLSARDQIMQSGMNDQAKQQAVKQLRGQHFQNPQEQLRLETFEQVHDQGGKLPFAD